MTARRLLLIGWEGAGLNLLNPLLDAGRLPAINQVIEDGAVGGLLNAAPHELAAQWTTVFTGKRAWQHGVALPVEFDLAKKRALPVSRSARKAAALWEMLAERGLRSIVAGFPATHGSQSNNLTLISNRYPEPTAPPGVSVWPPAPDGTYCPENLGSSLDSLRVSPENIGAGIVSSYIPNWQKIDFKRDRRLGLLRVALARELSLCSAFDALLRKQSWDFAAIHLPAMREICQFSLRRTNDIESALTSDFYAEAFRAQCHTLDRIVQSFRAVVGRETAIVLVSCTNRATSKLAHESQTDLFAASGPGFARDSLVFGATVLDVVPTLLAWFGLPIGDDMEGRVLLEAFSDSPAIQRIASWEATTGRAPIDAPPSPDSARLDWEWNMAQSSLEAGRLDDGLPRLRFLVQSFPERAEFCQALFDCELNLGKVQEAESTLEVLLDALPPGAPALVAQAELALAKKDKAAARRHVIKLFQDGRLDRSSQRRLGLLLLRLRQWQPLAQLARGALQQDQNDPAAWLGLAAATLRLGQFESAEEAARKAIQIRYVLPEAHFILSRALLAQSKWEAAYDAMSATLKMQPGNKAAANYQRMAAKKRPPTSPT